MEPWCSRKGVERVLGLEKFARGPGTGGGEPRTGSWGQHTSGSGVWTLEKPGGSGSGTHVGAWRVFQDNGSMPPAPRSPGVRG